MIKAAKFYTAAGYSVIATGDTKRAVQLVPGAIKMKIWRAKNPPNKEKRAAAVLRMKMWRINNPEKSKELRKKEYKSDAKKAQRGSEKSKTTMRLWRKNNRERINKLKRESYKKDKTSKRQSDKKYQANKIKTEPLYKLKIRIRTRLYQFFKTKGVKKYYSTAALLGLEYKEIFIYIQNKFIDGMTWGNYGLWHIDHIIPLSSAKTPQEIIRLCHYTNLQPLWALDNIIKSNKIL